MFCFLDFVFVSCFAFLISCLFHVLLSWSRVCFMFCFLDFVFVSCFAFLISCLFHVLLSWFRVCFMFCFLDFVFVSCFAFLILCLFHVLLTWFRVCFMFCFLDFVFAYYWFANFTYMLRLTIYYVMWCDMSLYMFCSLYNVGFKRSVELMFY
jgi:hypothetical protein